MLHKNKSLSPMNWFVTTTAVVLALPSTAIWSAANHKIESLAPYMPTVNKPPSLADLKVRPLTLYSKYDSRYGSALDTPAADRIAAKFEGWPFVIDCSFPGSCPRLQFWAGQCIILRDFHNIVEEVGIIYAATLVTMENYHSLGQVFANTALKRRYNLSAVFDVLCDLRMAIFLKFGTLSAGALIHAVVWYIIGSH